jgi:flagellin
MLSVVTNNGALMAQAALSSVNRDMETSMQRLSTGKRINAARDDAAGVAIASRLTSSVIGINQGIRNAMDAQALIDTAEGAMQETEALLQRIRELAVQASNDTNSANDRSNLDTEGKQLQTEIDRIASTMSWAGQNLLDGTFTNKGFQVGGGTMIV